MDENIRKKVAGGQRLGDPPRIGAAAFRQLAPVIVASDGELSLGVANEKQSAHETKNAQAPGDSQAFVFDWKAFCDFT
jgi:hypothetical protein